MYVYIKSEANLYTVGFYDPSGNFHPDSDYNDRNKAANRVSFLNGNSKQLEKLAAKVDFLDETVADIIKYEV